VGEAGGRTGDVDVRIYWLNGRGRTQKFSVNIEPNETVEELREQRRDLREELEHKRNRITSLEEVAHDDERHAIEEYLRENPGASYEEIIQHVAETVPERVTGHLEQLEGDRIRLVDDGYELTENND